MLILPMECKRLSINVIKFEISDSITSNIAEGSGRDSFKEKVHFIEFSYGSLMEVLSQMDVAYDLEYISTEEFINIEVW